MLSFVLRRVLTAIPTLFVVITLSFFLIRVAPGGPFDLERALEAKVMENLNRIYKLDQPLIEQYLAYVSALLRGDFGPSFYLRDFSVRELFAAGLPVSMTVGGLALAFATLTGGTIGCIAAFKQNSAVDYISHRRRCSRHYSTELRYRPVAPDSVRSDRSRGCRLRVGAVGRGATSSFLC